MIGTGPHVAQLAATLAAGALMVLAGLSKGRLERKPVPRHVPRQRWYDRRRPRR